MHSVVTQSIYKLIQENQNPSDLFEELCASMLKDMGFDHVYRRRGTEQGRDIDAEFAGYKWYFECKFVQESIDTASFAYKFLQLDALDPSQKPDFFVLLSNGSIKSILKDIVEFKAADKHTTYCVELWANHDSNLTFDDIILSNVSSVVQLLRDRLANTGIPNELDEFVNAGSDHVRTKGKFITRLLERPIFRNRLVNTLQDPLPFQFAIDATFSKVRSTQTARYGHHKSVLVVGVPETTRHGLLECSSIATRRLFAKEFSSWGMELELEPDSSIFVFRELGSAAYTVMTEWGAVATLESIPFSINSIDLSELFKIVKEHSVRFRNYLKRGTLATPCWITIQVDDLKLRSMVDLLGHSADNPKLRFRSLRGTYQHPVTFDPLEDDLVTSLPVTVQSIRLNSPPNDYSLIGGPLVERLWEKISGETNLLKSIRLLQRQLFENWSKTKSECDWNNFVELRLGFDYLLDEDRVPRPFEKFQNYEQI
jgi:hypothetical protein